MIRKSYRQLVALGYGAQTYFIMFQQHDWVASTGWRPLPSLLPHTCSDRSGC